MATVLYDKERLNTNNINKILCHTALGWTICELKTFFGCQLCEAQRPGWKL